MSKTTRATQSLEKLGVNNDVELARRMFDSWQ